MEGDEVADVGFQPADLFAARVERMDQADLIALRGVADVAGTLRQCDSRDHAAFLIRALKICGALRATSCGTVPRQRA